MQRLSEGPLDELTLSEVNAEETLLLRLDVEADLLGARIDQGEAAGDGLVHTAVAELDAGFGHARENGLTRRALNQRVRRLHHS